MTTAVSHVNSLSTSIKRIAIVGGGASGLIAADVFHSRGYTVSVFEKNKYVGGVWKYEPGQVMYNTLRTNLPKEIMAFNYETPFKNYGLKPHSYLTHSEVQEYLEDFFASRQLKDCFRFDCTVEQVKRVPSISNPSDNLWDVTYTAENAEHSEQFDAVMLCNGHYNKPYIPDYEGFDVSGIESYHSYEYDSIRSFLTDRRVLVVGSRSSGTDMARELTATAKEVIVSDRNLTPDDLPKTIGNLILLPGIRSFSPGGVDFIDGSHQEIDAVLWCTGFQYDYSFLQDPHTQVEDGKRVKNLYKHLFSIHDPTLTYIGLPFSIVPFPMFYLQARWIESVYSGSSPLPSTSSMQEWLQSFEDGLKQSGQYSGKYHFMGGSIQWDYCRELAKAAKVDDAKTMKYLDMIEQIYADNSANKPPFTGAPDIYRDRNYNVNR